ncbi:MAG: hypothetical protein N2447_01600, partial [Thermoanaerobaculum sp.]|nr:hypothetical protein [Thermoanaerobaculum sp.]
MRNRPVVSLCGLFLFIGGAIHAVVHVNDPGQGRFDAALGMLPRGFVANVGQWEEEAAFAAPGFYGTTWVTRGGELRHVLVAREGCGEEGGGPRERKAAVPCPAKVWVVSERFVGGRVEALWGEERLPGGVSFFLGGDPGRYRSDVPAWRRLRMGEVYPGVAVSLQAGQRTGGKGFEVAPGADPGRIVVKLEGAQAVRGSEAGALGGGTGDGGGEVSPPVAWQEMAG